MAQIFPRWMNRLPLVLLGGTVLSLVLVIGLFWYFGSPEYTDVGYQPRQPIPYSHKLHAGDLGLDCRYCHTAVEVSASASIPPTRTCLNCHALILPDSEKLAPLRASLESGQPLEWIRVHKLPDYTYFDHSIHIHAGVGCASCHGRVDQMEIVYQVEPLSMGWCLDCHRNPGRHLRPAGMITRMDWNPPAGQREFARQMIAERNLKPTDDCSGCHR